MNSSSVMDLIKALCALNKEGISEWNGCILSKEICVSKLNCSVPSPKKNQLMNSVFANATDIEDVQIQSYMWKATHPKTSSISQTPMSIDSIEPVRLSQSFDGSPLQLEDHLGDALTADSMDTAWESALLDESCLVPDEIFTYMMSCLCTAVTSHDFDEVSDKQTLLKSVFPLVVFWETLNIGHDRNGMILVKCMNDTSGKLSGLCVKRIRVVGQFLYNMWCGVTQNHLNTINFVKKKHMDDSVCALSTIRMESYAQFERLQANERHIKDKESSSSFAAVSVACNQVREILGTDTKHMSEVKIHIAPVPGDKGSPTFALYQDLFRLRALFNLMKNQAHVDENCQDLYESTEMPIDKVSAFLASYDQEWAIRRDSTTEDKNGPTSEENSLVKHLFQERKELDFTERAWDVLKKMKSAEDLKVSVGLILKKIEQGRNTQLWLHSNNQTTLAKVIRESYTGAVTKKPTVNDTTAAMLTIELGLDKMYRDYRSFFIGNRITVGSCLDAYKVTHSSHSLNDDAFRKHLKEQFILIQKLHHIAEFVIQCKTLLSLSDEVIFNKAGRILREYTAQELDFDKKFDFDVDFTEVKTMIVDRPPTVWKLILHSYEGKRKRSTCCTWMPVYPFQGILSPPMNESTELSNNSNVDDSLQYYVSIHTTSHLSLSPLASSAFKEFKWNNKM